MKETLKEVNEIDQAPLESNAKLTGKVGTHNLTELRRRLEEKMLLKVNAENRDVNRQEQHWPDVNSTPADTYGGEENTGNLADEISQHSADFSSNENLGANRHEEEEEDIPIQSFGKVKGNEDMQHLAVPHSENVFKTQSFA